MATNDELPGLKQWAVLCEADDRTDCQLCGDWNVSSFVMVRMGSFAHGQKTYICSACVREIAEKAKAMPDTDA